MIDERVLQFINEALDALGDPGNRFEGLVRTKLEEAQYWATRAEGE